MFLGLLKVLNNYHKTKNNFKLYNDKIKIPNLQY